MNQIDDSQQRTIKDPWRRIEGSIRIKNIDKKYIKTVNKSNQESIKY